jgi:Rod binding domain-containing protein
MDPVSSLSAATQNLTLDQARTVGKKPTLEQAGKAFETLFLQTMMKSARDAKLDDGLLNNEAEKPFISMLDNAYSELATKNLRLGIAEAVTRQFSPPPPKGAASK